MHNIDYLRDILILLFASVAIVVFFKQFGLSSALGYLVAGAAIGPYGFGVLSTTETTQSIAELGIVFLLFAIGLELTFEKLAEIRKMILGFGMAQLILTSVVGYFICRFFGLGMNASIIVAGALSLSSTAIVLQIIQENHEETTRVGRMAFGTLLMQDLAVIPILVLIPLLAKGDLEIGSSLLGAFSNAAVALAVIYAAGKLLLNPIYKLTSSKKGGKSDALFFSVTLIVVFGSSYLSHSFGLSSALGAFMAGIMVAETEHKHRVEGDINSIKSLLLGLFFMTIGMSFKLDLLLSSFPQVLMIALILIFVKSVLIVTIAKFFKFPTGSSLHLGLLLAQGGEFAFVVFIVAVKEKLITHELSQFLATVVTMSMALTPLLTMLARKFKLYLYAKGIAKNGSSKTPVNYHLTNHIIIVGFNKIGMIVAHILRSNMINYVVLDSSSRAIKCAKSLGYNAIVGDATNMNDLERVHIKNAESMVLSVEDELECAKISRFVHSNFSDILITTYSDFANVERLKKSGVDMVVVKNILAATELAKNSLISVGLNQEEIADAISYFHNLDDAAIKSILDDSAKLSKVS